jgi:hypothetical protein
VIASRPWSDDQGRGAKTTKVESRNQTRLFERGNCGSDLSLLALPDELSAFEIFSAYCYCELRFRAVRQAARRMDAPIAPVAGD